MADSRMKTRAKGLFGSASPDTEPPDQTQTVPDPDAQRRALQVLVLAQRTADEHVATAHQQADNIRADARATADQMIREAQAHADAARRDAGKALAEARAAADEIVRDARAHSESTRRDAEKILADARAKAEEITKEAQANAERLDREAQQRYQDVIGSMVAQRTGLQQQIEGLQQFERDYRSRLRTFMQGQLRVLGGDDSLPNADVEQPGAPTPNANQAQEQ